MEELGEALLIIFLCGIGTALFIAVILNTSSWTKKDDEMEEEKEKAKKKTKTAKLPKATIRKKR